MKTKEKTGRKGYAINMVHLVLHPHGIEPTFLNLYLLSPATVSIPIIKGINQIKKEKL